MASTARHLVALLLLAVPLASLGGDRDRHYEASLAEAEWTVESGELDCHLIHPVPRHGLAVFSRTSELEHAFRLYTHRPPGEAGQARIQVQEPSWQGHRRYPLGHTDLRDQQETVRLGHRLANRLLQELERGRRVLIRSDDWHGASEQVVAALSQTGFRQAYGEYLACSSQFHQRRLERRQSGQDEEYPGMGAGPGSMAPLLSRHGVPVIEESREEPALVYFTFDGSELTWSERDRLRGLAAELLSDPREPSLIVTGHTDSVGTAEYNQELGLQRARAARSYLVEQVGFPPARLTVESLGLAAPAAPNAEDDGQARNRRVELQPRFPADR